MGTNCTINLFSCIVLKLRIRLMSGGANWIRPFQPKQIITGYENSFIVYKNEVFLIISHHMRNSRQRHYLQHHDLAEHVKVRGFRERKKKKNLLATYDKLGAKIPHSTKPSIRMGDRAPGAF